MRPRIVRAQPAGPYTVALTFADGSAGSVNLAPWIANRGGVFLALQEPAFFAQVTVDAEAGTIVWPNGVDLDPDMLYDAAHPGSARISA